MPPAALTIGRMARVAQTYGSSGPEQGSAMRAMIATLGAMIVMSGCEFLGGIDAAAVCADQARESGPDFRVVGSFATTVGDVRGMTPGAAPVRWPELADDFLAVVCYLDGSVPKAPPDGEPYDRALIAAAGEHAELIMAGYRDQLPIEAP